MTEIQTLIQAMRILANDIQSDDGIANAAIWEAAGRLEELQAKLTRYETYIESQGLRVPE